MKMFLGVVLFLGVFPFGLEARTWISTDGKSIEAELVKLDGDVVVLLMGKKEFRVPLSRLSDSDQKYARAASTPLDVPVSDVSDDPGTLFGENLVRRKRITATGDLSDEVKKALKGNKLKPEKVKISVMLPDGFQRGA